MPITKALNKNTVNVTVFPASKGLVSSINPVLVSPESIIRSNNLIHTTTATRRTRPGVVDYVQSGFSTSEPVLGLWEFYRTVSSVQQQKIVAYDGTRFEADAADGNFVGVVAPATSFTGVEYISADILVGYMVVGIQGAGLYGYTQVDPLVALSGSPPNAWIVRKHRSRFFVAGVAAAPHTLYYSSIEDPTGWSGGTSGSINMDLGASDPVGITAIFEDLYGELYVAKWGSIYQVTTSSGTPFTVKPIVAGIGCVAHNAVKATQNDIIFPSRRGLHSLATTLNYGDVATSFLSFPVQDIWNNTVDFTRSQCMSAAFIPEYNSYLISYPVRDSDTYNVLGYNVATKDFFYWENFNASSLATYTDDQGRTRLIVGKTDGRIGVMDTLEETNFLDFGVSYESSFTTGYIFPSSSPNEEFGFKNLTLFYKPRGPEDITVVAQIDNRVSTEIIYAQEDLPETTPLNQFVLNQDYLGGDAELASNTGQLVGYGRALQITASCTPSDASTATAMEVLGYNIEVEAAEDTNEIAVVS